MKYTADKYMQGPLTIEVPDADSPRKVYFNPVLDPYYQEFKMTENMRNAVRDETYGQGGPLLEPDNDHAPNLVSSLCDDGLHRPALDIDVECTLIPSTTPGHYHLYFPTVALSWGLYQDLLHVLADAGIIDRKYVEHSLAREQTLLRPPGVRKHWVNTSKTEE